MPSATVTFMMLVVELPSVSLPMTQPKRVFQACMERFGDETDSSRVHLFESTIPRRRSTLLEEPKSEGDPSGMADL